MTTHDAAPGNLFAGGHFLNRVHFGDCRASLRMLIDAGVKAQMCVTSPPYFGLRSYLPADHADKHLELGCEETAEQFIDNLVDVFRLVRELLADDGTLWLNIGDTYAGSWGSQGREYSGVSVSAISARQVQASNRKASLTGAIKADGVKAKDLYGIPWMLAFALRADGWFLRQDIIWAKPNPMPESVADRCTKAHEYIFLLSKSASYFYDQDAIREPAAPTSIARWNQNVESQIGSDRVPGKTNGAMKAVGGARAKRDSFKRAEVMPHQSMGTHRPDRAESEYDVETRNRRSVWTVPTQPYAGAHFATFPPALIEPCILAGARLGDIVIDPFFGSGTTGQVAQDLGRQWIGCELNAAYEPLQQARTAQGVLFNEGAK